MSDLDIAINAMSKALFELDPAMTACVENDCTDEYGSIASHIFETMEEGFTMREAIEENFGVFLAIDLDEEEIDNICNAYFIELLAS